ncbi:hypothetical protein ABZW10_12345 [Kitasatospora sp. NPDC004723]|uniref:hypothetical protein n=1 Tax=Kitasatospora sp. NPDC004723 TaxID=3154288 RepID=UPI0033A9C420
MKLVRSEGLVRIRDLDLPLLRGMAVSAPGAVVEAWPVEVEKLLREAVSRLGGGDLQEAAELTLGLAPGMRDSVAAERRKRAARVYSLSTERFRKSQEGTVLAQVVEQLCWIAGAGARDVPGAGGTVPAPYRQHRELRIDRQGRARRVLLHIHPVEWLRCVDVVVSPSNTHFELPPVYKSSVAASLRRAAAGRDATGEVVADHLADALAAARHERGLPAGPVPPGAVLATAPGALARRGVRRIYHAAVTAPRPGTNDYDTTPQGVADAAARVLELMSREGAACTPPLRSVCFPLLGAGRGGLPVEASVGAMWPVLDADGGPDREVHLIVRRPDTADQLARFLGAEQLPPDGAAACSGGPAEGERPW